MNDLQFEVVDRAILERRSVKPEQMSSRSIDDDVVWQLLSLANWAPSHALTQPWRFRVFSGEGRKKLGAFLSSLYKSSVTKEQFAESKYKKINGRPSLVSHVLSIGMKRMENEKLPQVEEVAAVSCAVQNMCIGAYARGIGSYWGTGTLVYHPDFKSWIGLDEKDLVLGLLYLGYPLNGWPKSARAPIEDRVDWIRS